MEILRCKVCGKPYKAYISNSKYCSIGCKAKSQTYRIDFQKIVEMYERGMTQTEIANELGTTQKVIYNSFRRNGYKCRKAAKRNQLGKNNNSWVGDNATYATFHKRVESLYGKSRLKEEVFHAYGNAIVPQVAFEIFKAIEASIHSS